MATYPYRGRKKAWECFIFLVIILASLNACTGPGTATNGQPPIKIGYSASLTGPFANDGKALQQGFQLWRDLINQRGGLLGRQVELVGIDDKSDPVQVKSDYITLIKKDHVDLLLGPYSSLLTMPAATVTNANHRVLFAPTGNAAGIFKKHFHNYFVSVPPSQEYLLTFGYFILSLPQDIRPQTVAYVSVNSPFAMPQVAEAKQVLGNYVRAVYAPPPYPANSNIMPIAQAVARSQADVVVLGTSGLGDSVSFTKAFKSLHYNPKAIVETSGPGEGAQYLNAVGGPATAEGIFVPDTGWYPGATTYQSDIFTQAYIAQYGGSFRDISSTTAKAFGAAQVLEQAVEQTHSLDDAKLSQLLHSGTFNSVQGPIRFSADGGNTIGTLNMFQWIDGKLVLVYPVNNAQANPEYPKKNF
ncbi:amino acid ABC transporter substrate-binding protein [Dictyobacter aurantiacus]|uniref:Binding-protein-dependent transporter n=1 Tax=Dictyobacter aurantiacus TaxID=1936993 RepID=A0A401ZGK9_9CHLR|nr:amino acid ABC transporter substrate-binding protein [Dictyobacter aurantiacus]GCE06020.1 binding-protein-dependent transporter [Dictyobacter aurantiacus]